MINVRHNYRWIVFILHKHIYIYIYAYEMNGRYDSSETKYGVARNNPNTFISFFPALHLSVSISFTRIWSTKTSKFDYHYCRLKLCKMDTVLTRSDIDWFLETGWNGQIGHKVFFFHKIGLLSTLNLFDLMSPTLLTDSMYGVPNRSIYLEFNSINSYITMLTYSLQLIN